MYLCIDIFTYINIMSQNCSVTPKPKSVKEFFSSWYFWKPFLGVLIGGLGGFLYFSFVGCKSGTCAITSNPFSSMLFGGLFGFMISSSPCLKLTRTKDEKELKN
jgi:hypothetical protein